MRKKVLFVIESFVVGGAERVLVDLVNALDKEHFDVTVLSVFKESVYKGYNEKFDDMFSADVHHRYMVDNSVKWKYILFNFLFNRLPHKWFHQLFVGKGYDTEVAFYEGLPTVFLSCSPNNKSRKLAWLHYGAGFADSVGEKRERYRHVYSRFDAVVGVSKGVCDNFLARVGRVTNLEVKYNIIEDERIVRKSNEYDVDLLRNGMSFLSVGRICGIKGYDRLLRVCLKLHNEGLNMSMNIIGGGGSDELMAFVVANSMQKYVRFWGHKDNPYPYIKHADWLVCSSYAEGFSTVITESLIIGTPVISTDCSGTDELLGNSEYGIRCENSEDGLYEAMRSVLMDASLYVKYKKKAAEGGRRFNKEQLLQEIEQIL